MKKTVCSLVLVLLGLLPFPCGIACNRYILQCEQIQWGILLIGGCLLLAFWFLAAYLGERMIGSSKRVVILLNLCPFVVLILLGIQEWIFHAYWPGILGLWTQFYYLPLLRLGFTLTPWAHTMFPAYIACFLLMLGASILGTIPSSKKIPNR